MTATCHVCHARADANLCRVCTKQLEQAIAELPALYTDLELVATLQAAGPLGLGDPRRQWDGPAETGAIGDAPWAYGPGASDMLWVAGNTISTWVRHLLETNNRTLTKGIANAPAQWLLANLDLIRYDDAAAQLHDELTGLHHDMSAAILGRPPAEAFYGLCDKPDVRIDEVDGRITPVVSKCGAKLFGVEDAKRIDCPTCGASYSREERNASMLVELVDTLGTVAQVASTLTKLGVTVTVGQIDGWVRRKQILARSEKPRIVRVGDVLAQRAKIGQRRKVAA